MARKQIRGTQIFGIAVPSAILAFAFALTLALPLWAQAQRGRGAAPVPAAAIAEVDRDIMQRRGALDSVRVELERGRARVRELQNEEGTYLSRLEQIERNISASGRYIKLVQGQIEITEETLEFLGDSLAKAESELTVARELMKRRLRTAYMTGEINRLQMLLTARSPTEFVHRVRYFQDLNRYDRQLAEAIRDGIATVNEKRAAQEESKQELIKLLADKQKEQQALVDEEAERRTVLEDIRTRREASAAMVAELEETQRELDAIITMLESRRTRLREEEERAAVIGFENRKGKLSWPVEGRVTSRYGRVVHPVYRTVVMNDGIDIAAPKGTPVRSVAPGYVGMISRMRGLGQYVIIVHSGGFFTFYAHLDEVTVALDQSVQSGDEIGRVGETGTAGGPQLHFRIRNATESFNPEEWLVQR